jgi:hypothetical protein
MTYQMPIFRIQEGSKYANQSIFGDSILSQSQSLLTYIYSYMCQGHEPAD